MERGGSEGWIGRAGNKGSFSLAADELRSL
jgi:hypothetical protein